MNEDHGHVTPCFRPRLKGHKVCLHCERGTSCTKEMQQKDDLVDMLSGVAMRFQAQVVKNVIAWLRPLRDVRADKLDDLYIKGEHDAFDFVMNQLELNLKRISDER